MAEEVDEGLGHAEVGVGVEGVGEVGRRGGDGGCVWGDEGSGGDGVGGV